MWEALLLQGKGLLLLVESSSAQACEARVADQELVAPPLLLSVLLGDGAPEPRGWDEGRLRRYCPSHQSFRGPWWL